MTVRRWIILAIGCALAGAGAALAHALDTITPGERE